MNKASTIGIAELLAPISDSDFFSNYYGKQYLHIKGDSKAASLRAGLFDWEGLNDMLNMALVWSDKNMHVALDKKVISPAEFCLPQTDRNHQSAQVPDQKLVMQWLRKGASVILDDVDGLHVGLRAIAHSLQEVFAAKVQANLYCSWKQRQAFAVHYDTHDVFAVHFAGEKIWNIYETRIPAPVNHPHFLRPGSVHAEQCGGIKEQVCMRAGDVLYLPKGQYHDALTSKDNALHVAFGVHAYLGLDFARSLAEALVFSEEFREALPLVREGEAALAKHMRMLGDKIAAISKSPELLRQVQIAQSQHRYPQHDFRLPLDKSEISVKADELYRLGKGDFKIATQQGETLLVNAGRAVPLPVDVVQAVTWIVDTGSFTESQLIAKFFTDKPQKAQKLISDLVHMRVIVKSLKD